jgi:hypothetical protein
MHFPKRYFVLFSLTTAISLLTVSCTQSKVSECKKIMEVANRAVSEAKSVTNGEKANDPKSVMQAADAMEKASRAMEAINVKDEKLQDYQAGFINVYRDTSKATRNFIAASQKNDRSAAEAARLGVQQATTLEKQIVADFNTYCSGS